MRSLAREVAFKYVFSRLFNPSDEGLFDVLTSVLQDKADKDFSLKLIEEISANNEKYDAEISELSQNFKFERLFKADVCAIKIGMAELNAFPETPVAVVVDEAVKLSAAFSTEKSPDFVNGVLAAYVKRLK